MASWMRRAQRATVVFGMGTIALFCAAGPASAEPGATSAFGLRTAGPLTAGPFSASSCNPGTCTPDNLVNAAVPGLVNTGALATTATPTGASSSVLNVNGTLSPITGLTASAVSSSCTIDPTTGGVSGQSSIVNGAITTFGGQPITLESSAAPNTVVTVLDPTVASVVLNRQTTGPDGTLTVDAIYISLLNTQTITIATSTCTPTGNQIPMATGGGLLLGGGLLAITIVGGLLTRRMVVARRLA